MNETAKKRAVAHRKEVRISPRKVQIVLDTIRGKNAQFAKGILKNTPKRAAEPVLKLLNEAIANAENNFQMDKEKLFVAECYVTPGTTLKRIMARAQGRAFRILKRASHITIALEEKGGN